MIYTAFTNASAVFLLSNMLLQQQVQVQSMVGRPDVKCIVCPCSFMHHTKWYII